jgi:hypothetical protein
VLWVQLSDDEQFWHDISFLPGLDAYGRPRRASIQPPLEIRHLLRADP